jgi:hypothetical protein
MVVAFAAALVTNRCILPQPLLAACAPFPIVFLPSQPPLSACVFAHPILSRHGPGRHRPFRYRLRAACCMPLRVCRRTSQRERCPSWKSSSSALILPCAPINTLPPLVPTAAPLPSKTSSSKHPRPATLSSSPTATCSPCPSRSSAHPPYVVASDSLFAGVSLPAPAACCHRWYRRPLDIDLLPCLAPTSPQVLSWRSKHAAKASVQARYQQQALSRATANPFCFQARKSVPSPPCIVTNGVRYSLC